MHSTRPNNGQAPRFASQADAGDYAGVCIRTIRRWIATGMITGYRMGPRLIRVDLNEIDGLFAQIPADAA